MVLSFQQKLRSLCLLSLGGFGAFSAVCIYKEDEKFYKKYVMPLTHILDPEKAHRFGIWINKHRLLPKTRFEDPDILKTRVFNRVFPNPIGIAAGFDKNAEAIQGLQDIGFGFVEVGSVTPLPQQGNDKPRVFRLSEDAAVINRYGFNNDGHIEILKRLVNVKGDADVDGIVGVNLGKNKSSEDPIQDYVSGVETFGPIADYLVINISSPNTAGLRDMQKSQALVKLLSAVNKARNKLPAESRPPLLLKLAPDLTRSEMEDIGKVLKDSTCKVDGLIVCNTTVTRPDNLVNKNISNESGGLSGKPLTEISTKMIRDMYILTNGMPIIGVGGVSSGKDAYEKIRAGAVLVQLYTSMVYEGPPIVTRVKKDLAKLLARDGFSNVSEAVGKDVS